MALHLPTGPLKSRSGLEPVPRYSLADDLATAPLESTAPNANMLSSKSKGCMFILILFI